MSIITIGSKSLNYKTNENKYIITYVSDYNINLDKVINNIFNSIFPFYSSRKLEYSNVCGANAAFICKNLKIDGLKFGKIIITKWIDQIRENLQSIASVYGPNSLTIGASYHALTYLEVIIEEEPYYVAIETTSCVPYKLQFYIGSNYDELESIIKIRYHT